MACVIVPAVEAVVTAVAEKVNKKEEQHTEVCESRIPFSRKLKWLKNLLLGGSVLLAFEHFWHGEIVPFFPFLTAASNAADRAEMLHEMATTGVTMAVLCTLVWVGMLAVVARIEKSENPQEN